MMLEQGRPEPFKKLVDKEAPVTTTPSCVKRLTSFLGRIIGTLGPVHRTMRL